MVSRFTFKIEFFEIEEASKVAILTRLTPIFVIPLAVIFLGEVLTLNKYLGIILLAFGGIVISAKEVDIRRLQLSKGLLLITVFNLLIAGTSVARKFVLNHNEY